MEPSSDNTFQKQEPLNEATPSVSPWWVNLIACFIAIVLMCGLAAAGSYGSGSSEYLPPDFPLYGLCIVAALAINWIAFIPAYCCHTEKFYDAVGSVTFISCAALAIGLTSKRDIRSILLTVMIFIWTIRLGIFLFIRAMSAGDRRFDAAKYDFFEFLKYWTMQGLWVSFTAGAALAAICTQQAGDFGVNFSWMGSIGAAIWVIGFVIEIIADIQKIYFRKDPSNKGKYIATGLWALSRHPNYFGECVLWMGVALVAAPALKEYQFFTMVSPLFVFLLIRFGSGVPLLEEAADKKWGGQPQYEAYKERVPVFMLNPFLLCSNNE